MISYDPGHGHVEIYVDEDGTDEQAQLERDDSFPVEAFMTMSAAKDLLDFINTQLDVMKKLKIHQLSELSKPLQDLKAGLEHVLFKHEQLKNEPPF